jgi:hypothetical protein
MVLVGKEDNFGGVTIVADEAWKDANDAPGFKKALEVSARCARRFNWKPTHVARSINGLAAGIP